MLSVVLATYNEEENIAECLEAITDIADEIIVVDGSSTDQTRSIAKKLGARVIKTTNKPNFHINKQMAIDAAKGDLILQLDADEVVDEQLAAEISQIHQNAALYKNNSDLPQGWYLKRKNLFLGQFLTKGGQYPDPVIRLFFAGKGRLPAASVHEQMEIDGPVETLEGHLIHYSNRSFGQYLRKFNTYSTLSAHELYEKNTQPGTRLAIEYGLLKPVSTFFSLFVRHRGYVDGIAGFTFALMSALHHPVALLKFWELHEVARSS